VSTTTAPPAGTLPPGPRNFGQFVAEHEDGRFHAAATDVFHATLVAVRDAAMLKGGIAKGKLTLTLDIEMDGENIEIIADLVAKVPKLKRGRSIWWLTPQGHLCRSNPSQPELPLRDVMQQPSALTIRSLA